MLAWIWDKLVGNFCRYQWETFDEVPFNGSYGEYGTSYHMRCKKCGDLKFRRSV